MYNICAYAIYISFCQLVSNNIILRRFFHSLFSGRKKWIRRSCERGRESTSYIQLLVHSTAINVFISQKNVCIYWKKKDVAAHLTGSRRRMTTKFSDNLIDFQLSFCIRYHQWILFTLSRQYLIENMECNRRMRYSSMLHRYSANIPTISIAFDRQKNLFENDHT